MGRKVKARAFEEEGQAQRLPSNTEVAKYRERILTLRKKLKADSAKIRAEIKDAYADAETHGIDKESLKDAIKLIEAAIPFERKALTNIYLEGSGQYGWVLDEAERAAAEENNEEDAA